MYGKKYVKNNRHDPHDSFVLNNCLVLYNSAQQGICIIILNI